MVRQTRSATSKERAGNQLPKKAAVVVNRLRKCPRNHVVEENADSSDFSVSESSGSDSDFEEVVVSQKKGSRKKGCKSPKPREKEIVRKSKDLVWSQPFSVNVKTKLDLSEDESSDDDDPLSAIANGAVPSNRVPLIGVSKEFREQQDWNQDCEMSSVAFIKSKAVQKKDGETKNKTNKEGGMEKVELKTKSTEQRMDAKERKLDQVGPKTKYAGKQAATKGEESEATGSKRTRKGSDSVYTKKQKGKRLSEKLSTKLKKAKNDNRDLAENSCEANKHMDASDAVARYDDEKIQDDVHALANEEHRFFMENNDVSVTRIDLNEAMDAGDVSDDSQEAWEDVDEKPMAADEASPSKVVAPRSSVEISVAVASRYPDKSAKRRQQLLDAIKRCARKFKQEQQTELHKVHVLCLVAHGRHFSRLCNNDTLKGICLSLLPSTITRVSVAKWNVGHTERVVNWFKESAPHISTLLTLCSSEEKHRLRHLTQTHLLVLLLRSLGFLTRLVCSLQPVPWKISTKSKKTSPRQSNAGKRKRQSSTKNSATKKPPTKAAKQSGAANATGPCKSPYFPNNPTQNSTDAKPGPSSTKRKSKSSASGASPMKKLKRRQKKLNYKETNSSDDSSSESETEEKTHKRSSPLASKQRTPKQGNDDPYQGKLEEDEAYSRYSIMKRLVDEIDDDAQFEISSKPLMSKTLTPKATVSMMSFSSSESDAPLCTDPMGHDQWVEVYLPAEAKWICIELQTPSVNQPSKCERLATAPIQYVVSFDNDLAIKDVTCRYDSKWLSQTRRQRVDRDWWGDVVAIYPPKDKIIDTTEDAYLHSRLLEQPLPKSIGEFKGHALFALERHLLKYEAIYPRTAATVGFIRSEAVYSRDCVHTLHSRENWMMEARVVRSGEEPYKVVRGRPKKSTPLLERDKVKLELFGKWQTDVYKPPPAKNGIVPKNEYGNIELFKPCMLPAGTVHVPVQGIQKVAKKLKIDFAPAMMGWDFHSGYCHPIIEGVVICKEFKQKLLDAWDKEEDEIRRRAKERREKKILDRWRHIVKSLLVGERLKRKYNFEESH